MWKSHDGIRGMAFLRSSEPSAELHGGPVSSEFRTVYMCKLPKRLESYMSLLTSKELCRAAIYIRRELDTRYIY